MHLRILSSGLLALAAAVAMVFAASASATVVTTSTGGAPATPTIHVVNEGGHVVLATPIASIACSSTIDAKVENHGAAVTASGSLTTLNFTGCTNSWHVTSATTGNFEIHHSSGAVISSGAKVDTTRLGVTCIFETNNTKIGTLTSGNPATLHLEASLPVGSGSSGLCGTKAAKWEGSYVTTSALYVEAGSSPTSTSLSTSLKGGGKEGAAITVNEGTKVKDTATLSGTNSSKATGTVNYKVFADKECKELVGSAGEVSVSGGTVPASSEIELTAGAVYYWQAEYSGDANNLGSVSPCSNEVLTVKAAVTVSTKLVGEGEEGPEGKEITVPAGAEVLDTATLSGTNSSKATGTITYSIYADSKCEELVAGAGGGEVTGGNAASSEAVELAEGTYYWRASYSGGPLHQAAESPCDEVLEVISPTTLATTLSGEGEVGEVIEVSMDAAVTDSATLSGPKASEATGTVEYSVYADDECTELVASAGEVEVEGAAVPSSEPIELEEPGYYFWRAVYSGDGVNYPASGRCGDEIQVVLPRVTTELTAGARTGEQLEVATGTAVTDRATLHGANVAEATGTLEYFVYADDECTELVASAGEVAVAGATVPSSEPVELEEPGVYYWQADYSGGGGNPAALSPCGIEILAVVSPTSISTTLTGGEKEGPVIEVEEGTPISDQATLSGANAATAGGTVTYSVYADSECTELAASAGSATVSSGTVGPSEELTLPPGTYYWVAEYYGDGVNQGSIGSCGGEVATVTAPITGYLSGEGLNGGSESGEEIQVPVETPVTYHVTLHTKYASEATGTVKYKVFADDECTELVASAGEVEVEGATVPTSEPIEFEEPGVYYWEAEYSGDGKNPPATSKCVAKDQALGPEWTYAALGDSYSSGEGVGKYYAPTHQSSLGGKRNLNECHRTPAAWPALIAGAAFGSAHVEKAKVFQRNPQRFIFRACSGAVASNIWSGGKNADIEGQYDELSTPPALNWIQKPAQATWLSPKDKEQNKNIGIVGLTIGGNDAGFGSIVGSCIYLKPIEDPYDPKPCQKAIAEKEKLFGNIEAWLLVVLAEIRNRAPKATIRVFLYPKVLKKTTGEIELGLLGKIRVSDVVPLGSKQPTAVDSLLLFTERLNNAISEAVRKTGDPKVVADTSLVNSLNGHVFGDKEPWMGGLTLPLRESIHPNECGHKAMGKVALEAMINNPLGVIELCK
ncbi:MAG TPA: SGNH/GDSL hydrolase family protein [Solirubrobacterales bacterium]|nr:SGNH/GDSL hydrolase family protein [Solirubrobacterales bacterium]